MKFTIIIPAYNLEGFLTDCLRSIQSQSFVDFEALIVDDGSTDGTARVAQEFADCDNRFSFFSKENGGVSSARNFGLERVQGEFVWFIDGDDYIHPESLSYLNKIFLTYPDADYVTFPFRKVSMSYAECEKIDHDLSTDGVICFDASSRQGLIDAFLYSPREACVTCYRRTILENQKFASFRLGEDTLFAKQMIYKAKRVVWAPASMYFYYHRESSASHGVSLSRLMDYFKVCRELYAFKGKRNGWADDVLTRFCFEVSLVDGMTRLQNLSHVNERNVAYKAWASNADAFLDQFPEFLVQKKRLKLICSTRSYWLSWLFFYVRYMPRRLIAQSENMAAILGSFRRLLDFKKGKAE